MPRKKTTTTTTTSSYDKNGFINEKDPSHLLISENLRAIASKVIEKLDFEILKMNDFIQFTTPRWTGKPYRFTTQLTRLTKDRIRIWKLYLTSYEINKYETHLKNCMVLYLVPTFSK